MWKGMSGFKPKSNNIGFIYVIKNIMTGQKYIGSKRYWSRTKDNRKKSPTYGQHVIKESNWRTYQSSNKLVQAWPENHIIKTMLCQCYSLYELTYREIEMLIRSQALIRDDYINHMLGANTIGRVPDYMRLENGKEVYPMTQIIKDARVVEGKEEKVSASEEKPSMTLDEWC